MDLGNNQAVDIFTSFTTMSCCGDPLTRNDMTRIDKHRRLNEKSGSKVSCMRRETELVPFKACSRFNLPDSFCRIQLFSIWQEIPPYRPWYGYAFSFHWLCHIYDMCMYGNIHICNIIVHQIIFLWGLINPRMQKACSLFHYIRNIQLAGMGNVLLSLLEQTAKGFFANQF